MTFLTPFYAAVAAAIAVPSLLILYFLKLKRQDLDISSTFLWKKAIQDLQANAPFQKLRRNLLLFLQLLILTAAVFSLAQPQLNAQKLSGERHVIMLDRSASMATLDASDGRGGFISRLDAAKKAAAQLVDSLKEPGLIDKDHGDLSMVIAFDSTASVVEQFTGDKQRLKDAINAITQGDGTTGVEDAVRLARAQAPRLIIEGKVIEGAADRYPLTMHLFTDGKIADADKAKPGPTDTVLFHRTGAVDTPNIGIVALRAERAFNDPAQLSVYVGLQSTDKDPRALDVELLIDGITVSTKPTTMPPAIIQKEAGASKTDNDGKSTTQMSERSVPGSTGVVFNLERPAGNVVEVKLRRQGGSLDVDAFDSDNRGWAVIPPAKRLAVAYVSRGNLFISNALEVLPAFSKVDKLTPEEYQGKLNGGKLSGYDVFVLDGFLPDVGGKKNALPPGRFLVLNGVPNPVAAPMPPADPAPGQPPAPVPVLGPVLVDQGTKGPSEMIEWVTDHPALRYISLDAVSFGETRVVAVPPGSTASVLASTNLSPAILEIVTADTRALVVPSDLSSSNWAFDPSFLVFMGSAVEYVGAGAGTASQRMIRPGRSPTDRLPIGVAEATMEQPGGKKVKLGVSADGTANLGTFERTGVYKLTWEGATGPGDSVEDGRPARYYACNLTDSRESDVAAAKDITLATQGVKAEDLTGNKNVQKLWPWLLLAALAVMLFEWYIYNRKVYL